MTAMMQSIAFRSILLAVGAICLFPFLAHADASASIQSLSPGATVPIGTQATFIVVGSGFNAALTYTLQDSDSGSSITNANINSSGVFSWIPATADIGDHTITVTVSDGTGNSVPVTTVLTVPPKPAVTIFNTSASSVYAQSSVFFSTATVGFTNPQFSVSDSFKNSSISLNSINSAGGFSWTPKESDIGSHTIKVTVTDSQGHTASDDISVTVKDLPSLSMSPALGTTTTLYAGSPLTLTLKATDFTSPTFDVKDALPGSSLNSYSMNMYTGIFSWTPKNNDLGLHPVTFTANDYTNGRSANMQILITVLATTTNTTTSSEQVVTPYSGPTTLFATSTIIGKALPNIPGTPIMVNTNVPDLKFYFATNIAPGAAGAEVSALQNALTQLGFYSGPISGTFGPLTKNAVMAFQRARGIEAVGTVGPMTRAALNNSETSSYKAAPTDPIASDFAFTIALSIGSRGIDVTELQKRLIALGLLTGEPTGYFGQLTAAGVKAYQASKGLEAVGNLGPKTRAALNSGK
jgi:peptidoglycan hydrolase-like protein with peptidoglycan-binding domain